MTKICRKCKVEKSVEFFYKRGKTGRQSWCKECCAIRHSIYYKANIEVYAKRRVDNRLELRNWFNEIKESLKCNRCPENHPSTLQFHHIDPEEKELCLAQLVSNGHSKERILAEIEKCEVLCANCHSKEHYQQEKWLFRNKK